MICALTSTVTGIVIDGADLHRAAARHLLHAQGRPSIMIPLLATKEVLAIVCVLCSPSPLEIRMANMPPHLRWFAALGHQRALRLVGCILVGGPQGNLLFTGVWIAQLYFDGTVFALTVYRAPRGALADRRNRER
ncbi:hypothetical protein HYPSUDRAFT_220171, partial [Hypholoma sublateritium FD-334 SS-4]